jgi:hypothetical protein
MEAVAVTVRELTVMPEFTVTPPLNVAAPATVREPPSAVAAPTVRAPEIDPTAAVRVPRNVPDPAAWVNGLASALDVLRISPPAESVPLKTALPVIAVVPVTVRFPPITTLRAVVAVVTAVSTKKGKSAAAGVINTWAAFDILMGELLLVDFIPPLLDPRVSVRAEDV